MPTVDPVPAEHPDLARLTAEVVAEYAVRYDDPDGEADAASPEARWVLVRDDGGEAVGCGARQPWSWTVPGAPRGVGELKRMYVVPTARGRGLGRLLLESLVAAAYDDGLDALVVETGTAQPEAIGLYTAAGFRLTPSWGQYADDPRSRCYRLELDGLRG